MYKKFKTRISCIKDCSREYVKKKIHELFLSDEDMKREKFKIKPLQNAKKIQNVERMKKKTCCLRSTDHKTCNKKKIKKFQCAVELFLMLTNTYNFISFKNRRSCKNSKH